MRKGMEADELLVTIIIASLLIGVPTGAMYFRTMKDEINRSYVWISAMLAISILLPILGPFILWVVYKSSVPQ
ncbi:hypothetical protein ACERIM_06835 [Natrinema sp. H-ect1]|uniref:hypothetical protein n=1 Tax=Natrinema sp. H-ect1 TaxID=3242700 RepID=UPI00359D4932